MASVFAMRVGPLSHGSGSRMILFGTCPSDHGLRLFPYNCYHQFIGRQQPPFNIAPTLHFHQFIGRQCLSIGSPPFSTSTLPPIYQAATFIRICPSTLIPVPMKSFATFISHKCKRLLEWSPHVLSAEAHSILAIYPGTCL